MASRLLIVTFLLAAAAPALAAASTDKRVYKVDSVIATAKPKSRVVEIQAKGAVQTGGWRKARLPLLRNDGKTLTLEFLAAPPPAEMTVIDQLVPVKATAEIHTRHRITSVHVIADANEVTAQILH